MASASTKSLESRLNPSAVPAQTVMDLSNEPMLLLDQHLQVLHANTALINLCGRSTVGIHPGTNLQSLLHNPSTQSQQQILGTLRRATELRVATATQVTSFIHPSNGLIDLDVRMVPLGIRVSDDNLLIVNRANLAENNAIERELAHRLPIIADSSRCGLWEWEPTTGGYREHGLWRAGLGYDDTQSIRSFDELLERIHPEDRVTMRETCRHLASENDQEMDICIRQRAADGSYRWIQCQGQFHEYRESTEPGFVGGAMFDVTDFKTAEAELIRKDSDLNLALGNAKQGVWDWDPETNEFYASASLRDLFGYTTEDMETFYRSISDLIHPDDLISTRDELINLVNGSQDFLHIEQRILHRRGHWLHCLVRGRVVESNATGRVTRITGTHTDITDLKNAREALRESETKLKTALGLTNQGIWEWHPETDTFSHLGYESAIADTGSVTTSPKGREVFEKTHPDDRSKIRDALRRYLRGETPTYSVTYRKETTDGTYRTYLIRGEAAERDPSGRVLRMLGTLSDVTELETQHQRLELALTNGRQGMWEWHPIQDRIDFSDSWYTLYGYDKSELSNVRTQITARIHPEDVEDARAALIAVMKGDQDAYAIEYRFQAKSGEYIWVHDRGAVIDRDSRGRAALVVGTHVDITAQKSVESDLQQSQTLLKLVLDTMPDMVYWKDTTSTYLGGNLRYTRAAGLERVGDIVGRTDFEMPWAEYAPTYRGIDKTVIETGETHISRQDFRDADGVAHVVETSKVPLLDETGTTVGVLGISQEITQQRMYEKQLEKIAECITGGTNNRLLDALAKGATELSGISCAFISTLDSDGIHATIVSTFPPNDALLNSRYALKDTPCEPTSTNDVCVYPAAVQDTFPDDIALQKLDVESYVGKRLLGADNEVIGIFALYDERSLIETDHAVSVLNIVAATAASEITREQRETALRVSEDRFRTIYDDVPAMICTVDNNDRIVDINKAWVAATGFNVDESVGTALADYFSEDTRSNYRDIAESNANLPARKLTLEFRCKNGLLIKVTCSKTQTVSPDGVPVTITVLEDITQRLNAEQQMRLAATAFETHEALIIRDAERRILRVNTAFTTLTGYGDAMVLGQAKSLAASDGDEELIWQQVRESGAWDGERNYVRANGSKFSVWQTITAVSDENGVTTHFVENFTDISELKQALADAERLALYDPLTELPNRRYLTERLEANIALARRNGTLGALLFIDLDQFKNINDSLGHAIGDGLLIDVARRLSNLTRKEDTISRLGGDEFVIILPNLGKETRMCIDQARRVADKIHSEFDEAYEIDGHRLNITPTIGVTLFPEAGKSVDDLLQEADSAMYKGKADGRNVTKFFHPSMQSEAQSRLGLERDLRTAVENNELELYFQPQYDGDGRLFAAEALLRWHHPTRGSVSPGLFIPIAEDSGLILDIGQWVLMTATDCVKRWERDGNLFIDHLAVNVSSRQFRAPDFVHDVIRKLVAAGVSPKLITLEVTEGTVIDNFDETARKMAELRDIGIGFSVDDFGIGYSSLSYLSRLPLDQLKIDRSFVTDVLDDPSDAVITETIIGMGANLHLNTIAEGVETEAQLAFLREHGCNGFQGYLFSKPIPEQEFLQLDQYWKQP